MKRKYDLAMSIGGACGCSKSLRNAGLQFSSFPFDWLNGATIRTRADVVRDDFRGWLEEANLQRLPDPEGIISEAHWRDMSLGLSFVHDFDRLIPMHEALPAVKEKYARRIAQLYSRIGQAKKVLLMWTDVPTSPLVTDEDLAYVRRTMSEKFPGVAFDVIAFRWRQGVRLEDREEREQGGIRSLFFDYMDKESDIAFGVADDKFLGKWLATEYETVDYRTPEDIRRWKKIAKKNLYHKFGGKSLVGYWIGKMEYKLYKHLRKQLKRKGVVS